MGFKNVDIMEANNMFEATRYAKGEHNLQLHATAKLEEMGFKNVNVMEANTMFEATKYAKGEHNHQLHAKGKLEEMGFENVDVMEANKCLKPQRLKTVNTIFSYMLSRSWCRWAMKI